MILEIWAAPLPKPLTPIAVHLFILVYQNDKIFRWELWQSKSAFNHVKKSCETNAQLSYGHVYQNLKPPYDGVGGGEPYKVLKLNENDSERLYRTLIECSPTYHYRHFYLAWPGPNSNTYIAYLFNQAGLRIELPTTAIGKNFSLKYHLTKESNYMLFQALGIGFQWFRSKTISFFAFGLTVGFSLKPIRLIYPFGKGLY